MKKIIFNTCIFSVYIALFFIFTKPPLSNEEKKALYQQKVLEWHFCPTEQHLALEEIFVKGMKQYWNKQKDWVLNYDDYLKKDWDHEDPKNNQICQIKKGQFFSDICYPWIINSPINLNHLSNQYPNGIKEKNISYFLRKELNAQSYDFDKISLFYSPEKNIQKNNFLIFHYYYYHQVWYFPDCCQVVDFKDYQKELNQKNILVREYWEESHLRNTSILKKINFLKVKKRSMFINGDLNFKEHKTSIIYYPINKCGDILDI